MSQSAPLQSEERARPRFTLAIELSNPSASPDAHAVALFLAGGSGDGLVGSLAIPAGVRSADALMVLVESLCAEHGCAPGDLAQILVSVGPGGYTALRISTTTAKVLAETIGCRLVAVPTAHVAALAIEPGDRPALIALAAKNDRAHCSIVSADGSIETVGVIDANGLESLGVRSIVGDGHLPRSFVECGERLGVAVLAIELDARRCLGASDGLGAIKPDELCPIYARAPDAVTQWRARNHD